MPTFELAPEVARLAPAAPAAAESSDCAGVASELRTGQLLLGTDKRNPVFAVYEDDTSQRLLVFYGFEIIEVLNNDPQTPAFKLLLGRLYNSGIKLKSLCESFQVSPKTIRGWGQAQLQDDPAELIRVIEGRSAGRKLTAEVERFARLRWPELVAERRYGAVDRLRGEIQKVFQVEISRSGLQPLIRKLKAAEAAQNPPPAPGVAELAERAASPEPAETPPGSALEKGEMGVNCCPRTAPDEAPSGLETPGCGPVAALPPGNIAHRSAFFPKDPAPANYWCDHAGVLVFASALAAVSKVSLRVQPILAQWIAALWLGAHNIEQTKFLNWEDLELILGAVVRFPTPQRDQLKLLAEDVQVIESLWRFNLANLGPEVGNDFYYDPHTKHYTGEQNVLKGWCPKIRFADKVLHSDFMHTVRGEPIYFETTDNFTDLRQRFFGVIQRAREALQWPLDRELTLIVDRGVFGAEFFQTVIGQPQVHVITWQKGFVAQAWDPKQVTGKTTLTRCRNDSTDLRLYQFEYVDGIWEQNTQLRQIVVLATNDQGRTIQVAILTDDLKRGAAQIIQRMFQRWLQENDFKYLDKHFGINEITSYRSIEYEKLKGQVEDREVKSAARKALDLSHKKETEHLKRTLLAEDQALQAHLRRTTKHQELEAQLAKEDLPDTPSHRALQRRIAATKAADRRYENARLERSADLDKIRQRLEGIQAQIAETQPTQSRLEIMIEGQMVKMDGQCKRLLDLLRITARNLFYRALQPFKKAYDNYRDDHDHFRKLTQSPGVLEVSDQQIVIHLLPRTNYGSRLRKVVSQTLEAMSLKAMDHPCLPGRKLKFRLGHRSEMEVKMNVDG